MPKNTEEAKTWFNNEFDQGDEIVVSMAPINSSGDMVHILALLMLAQHKEYRIPKVILLHDAATTTQQATRSLHFGKMLGFAQYLSMQALPRTTNGSKPCYQPRPRQVDFDKWQKLQVQNSKKTVGVYDQMRATTLLMTEMHQHGNQAITEHLRQRFLQWDETYVPKTVQTQSENYAKTELATIAKTHKKDQPLMLIHYRYSSDANSVQNFNGDLVQALCDYLDKKGYYIVMVYADSRKARQPKFRSTHHASYPMFPDKLTAKLTVGDETATYEYAKLKHIALLEAVRGVGDSYVGTIGNTSGTIDQAALMGHPVFNIHTFGKSLCHQSLRILLQSQLMSVNQSNIPRHAQANEDADATLFRTLPKLSTWLKDPKQRQHDVPDDVRKGLRTMAAIRAEIARNRSNDFKKLLGLTLFTPDKAAPRGVFKGDDSFDAELDSVISKIKP